MLYVSENPGRAVAPRIVDRAPLSLSASGGFLFLHAMTGQVRCDQGDLEYVFPRLSVVISLTSLFSPCNVQILYIYCAAGSTPYP